MRIRIPIKPFHVILSLLEPFLLPRIRRNTIVTTRKLVFEILMNLLEASLQQEKQFDIERCRSLKRKHRSKVPAYCKRKGSFLSFLPSKLPFRMIYESVRHPVDIPVQSIRPPSRFC
ncbi:hypothetical protein AVEN_51320-1 [Araneus ventricosus]|uniref:Uncharacterized protein n=1 Tax=Araneus ventricosus TaxID=182803 RepID=A0A4Y2TP21_ARAVE|nr:hypothetical protein AVEN_51320-1 [Araneus ventricosus]